MGLRVKDPGASESRLVIGRIGVVTSSHPKGGRLPGGVGGRETSANRRRLGCRDVGGVVTAFAGAPAATAVLSVAGSAAVGSRLAPRPMGPTACLTRARCPMLELYAGKLARTVLRGRGGSNASLLPDREERTPEGAGWHLRGERCTLDRRPPRFSGGMCDVATSDPLCDHCHDRWAVWI
jgi:hypothetical protein